MNLLLEKNCQDFTVINNLFLFSIACYMKLPWLFNAFILDANSMCYEVT